MLRFNLAILVAALFALISLGIFTASARAQQQCYTTCTTWNGQLNCVTNCQ